MAGPKMFLWKTRIYVIYSDNKSMLAITGALQNTSREKIYQELGLESVK